MKPLPYHNHCAGGEDAAATTGAGGGNKTKVFTKVESLSGDTQNFIDQLLIEGATFEDVVENMEEQGLGRVSLQAVATYFRNNMDLQKRRVLRQVERAQELKKSLGDPDSAEAELADAMFFTGYLGVTRKSAELRLKDMESIRLGKENLRLRNRVLRLRERKLEQDRDFNRARTDVMLKKLELLQLNINQLKNVMGTESKKNKLGPETLQKIQEIYGIAALPTVPAPR